MTIRLEENLFTFYTFELRDISDGRSGCVIDTLSGNPRPNPTIVVFYRTIGDGMMCGTVENCVLECRVTFLVCQNSNKTAFSTYLLYFIGFFYEKTS